MRKVTKMFDKTWDAHPDELWRKRDSLSLIEKKGDKR